LREGVVASRGSGFDRRVFVNERRLIAGVERWIKSAADAIR
jgi:hypothetical protein